MEDNERITYEEFMIMFRNAPRMAYMLYDKAEDEIEKYKNVIDKIKEDLIKTKKYNTRCQDKYGNEFIKVDIDHINYLLELLEEVDKGGEL